MLGKKDKKKDKDETREIMFFDLADGDKMTSAGAVNGREVAIFRPPVMLSPDGKTMPGVSKDLVARYLVATTAALADADLGAVTVEWRAQEGRFCETAFHIPTWGQTIEVIHPIAPVSQPLANAWEVYKAGIALKARELHKGHQQFGNANALITRAMRDVDKLRDDDVPHYSDSEYLFLQTSFQKALVMSALLPDSGAQSEQVTGTTANVA
jgi:hypothetical protein